jgi:hypothetical protein
LLLKHQEALGLDSALTELDENPEQPKKRQRVAMTTTDRKHIVTMRKGKKRK